jgi:hypothetical protein
MKIDARGYAYPGKIKITATVLILKHSRASSPPIATYRMLYNLDFLREKVA